MKTVLKKSHYSGNIAESMSETDANGQAWQITTSKNGRGQITCTAVQGNFDGSMFSYEMFGAKKLALASAEGKATENLILEVHKKGLEAFEALQVKEVQTKPAPYVIGVGQILFTDGPWESNRRAICEVLRPGNFRSVSLDGSGFRYDSHIKPYTEKYGIGTYYDEGDTITAEAVAALVIAANESESKAKEAKEAAENEAERLRLEAIEAGRKVITAIPAGVVAVIVAENHEDKSDSQSDYHGYNTTDVVYLAFSNHKKDLFPEMRKAADKFPDTAHLGTGKGIFTPYVGNTSERDFEYKGRRYYRKCESAGLLSVPDEIPTFNTMAEAQTFIDAHPLAFDTITADNGEEITLRWTVESKEIEHREKYSMGAGYYLGESHYHGWVIKKRDINDSAEMLEKLQIAAGRGKYFCNVEDTKEESAGAANFAPVPTVAGELNVIDYSEKAIAVIGDTKPIKDQLSSLGGSFNARLSCGPGWIFSKKRLQAVQTFLNNLTIAA